MLRITQNIDKANVDSNFSPGALCESLIRHIVAFAWPIVGKRDVVDKTRSI